MTGFAIIEVLSDGVVGILASEGDLDSPVLSVGDQFTRLLQSPAGHRSRPRNVESGVPVLPAVERIRECSPAILSKGIPIRMPTTTDGLSMKFGRDQASTTGGWVVLGLRGADLDLSQLQPGAVLVVTHRA